MSTELSPLSVPVNEFSVSLFDRLSSRAGQENVFVSPFSVSTALSMLMLGAKTTSEEQLRKGLMFHRLEGKAGENVHSLFENLIETKIKNFTSLLLSNYILLHTDLENNQVLAKYKADLESLYSAKLDDVDFAKDAVKIMTTVNEWVDSNTKGMIKKILTEPPSPDTRLILLNAIYFKGKWKKPFDKQFTAKQAFYNKGENEKQTDFMTMYDNSFPYLKQKVGGEETQVLEMAYVDDHNSMIIILPENRNGLKAMLAADSFTSDLSSIITTMQSMRQTSKVNVFIPKFEFETEYSLRQTLREMGMNDMFSTEADFSGITGARDLFVSEVIHKAVVKVDEEGTEAAAVTAVIMMKCCAVMSEPPINFTADHPFLFLIKNKETGLVLFIGKVEQF